MGKRLTFAGLTISLVALLLFGVQRTAYTGDYPIPQGSAGSCDGAAAGASGVVCGTYPTALKTPNVVPAGQCVTLEQYGAAGTGLVADDTAMTNALNALSQDAGWKQNCISLGSNRTYLLNQSHTVPTGATIQGQGIGVGSSLITTTAQVAVFVTASAGGGSGTTFQNFSILGNGGFQTGQIGIQITHDDVNVFNVKTAALSMGIEMTGLQNDGLTHRGPNVTNFTDNGSYKGLQMGTSAADTVQYATIINPEIYGNGYAGIDVWGANNTFVGGSIHDVYGNSPAMHIEAVPGNDAHNVITSFRFNHNGSWAGDGGVSAPYLGGASLLVESVTDGQEFTDCKFYNGDIVLRHGLGARFYGCEFGGLGVGMWFSGSLADFDHNAFYALPDGGIHNNWKVYNRDAGYDAASQTKWGPDNLNLASGTVGPPTQIAQAQQAINFPSVMPGEVIGQSWTVNSVDTPAVAATWGPAGAQQNIFTVSNGTGLSGLGGGYMCEWLFPGGSSAALTTNNCSIQAGGGSTVYMNPSTSGYVGLGANGQANLLLYSPSGTEDMQLRTGYNLSVGSLSPSYGGGQGGLVFLPNAGSQPSSAISNGVILDAQSGGLNVYAAASSPLNNLNVNVNGIQVSASNGAVAYLGSSGLQFGAGDTSSQNGISQVSSNIASATCAALPIAAQSCTGTTSIGGDLPLEYGTGTSSNGHVLVGKAGVTQATAPMSVYDVSGVSQVSIQAPISGGSPTTNTPLQFAQSTVSMAGTGTTTVSAVQSQTPRLKLSLTATAAVTLDFSANATTGFFLLDFSGVSGLSATNTFTIKNGTASYAIQANPARNLMFVYCGGSNNLSAT
jgi:3D (Asp-Asp-Asp) domain-containing protein